MADQEYTFDKFMDRILIEEGQDREERTSDAREEPDPRRVLIERYTERVNNSIRYVKK